MEDFGDGRDPFKSSRDDGNLIFLWNLWVPTQGNAITLPAFLFFVKSKNIYKKDSQWKDLLCKGYI
jgi:hypothetical protein